MVSIAFVVQSDVFHKNFPADDAVVAVVVFEFAHVGDFVGAFV